MTPVLVIPVEDQSQVGAARRAAAGLGAIAGLSAGRSGDLAIVVTELATNLVKHAGGGQVLAQVLDSAIDGPGVELLSLDKGPGMESVARCMQDGYSTAGSPGNGLGAILRLASDFGAYSRPGQGTIVLARVKEQEGPRATGVRPAPPTIRWGGVSVPVAGETECGDAYCVLHHQGRTSVLVVDGLGHGPLAAQAAWAALRVFEKRWIDEPVAVVASIHEALRSTRGAAVALGQIDAARGLVRYCGVGNIVGAVAAIGGTRHLVSHNGTAGQGSPRFKEFAYPWEAGATLIMHSDGLMTRWDLAAYQGILAKDPSVIAGVLYRDFARGRDDATVVAVQEHRA